MNYKTMLFFVFCCASQAQAMDHNDCLQSSKRVLEEHERVLREVQRDLDAMKRDQEDWEKQRKKLHKAAPEQVLDQPENRSRERLVQSPVRQEEQGATAPWDFH